MYASRLPSGETAITGKFKSASCWPAGRERTKCPAGAATTDTEDFRFQTAMAATAALNRHAAIASPAVRRWRAAWDFVSAVALGGCDPTSPIHCNSDAKSCADCHRWSGSLAKQTVTKRATAGEIIGFNSETRGGS